ncbi:hypothetical protein QAD02_009917 [Eretmocerus hayati]|uniref:Uncharacterized protein n=1 Tax=Eretmocerus hayati TaxID=131215 RepID=A0ACC2ND26_9HYME|nr:hypothetical protein QAD02_009917 [Eretmocerus hayati]
MKIKYFLFSLYFLSYSMINVSNAEPIVGKNVKKVEVNEYPFIVSLHGYSRRPFVNKKHFCGGTLISQNHVLTASHCIVEDSFMKEVEVIAGSPNLKSNNLKRFKPIEWLKFKDWAHKKGAEYKKGFSDIAVLKLNVDDTGIKHVTLLPPQEVLSRDSDFILAGWGITNGGSIPTIMRKVSLKMLSKADCMSRVDYLQPNHKIDIKHDSALCFMATPYALGLCGDSGSPFLDKNLNLVGVHSGRCPYVQGFHHLQVNLGINVNYFREFIEYAIQHL